MKTGKRIRAYFIFGLSISLILASCSSQNSRLSDSVSNKKKYNADELDDYFLSLSDPASPGFSYLISKDGEIILKGGIGLADVGNNEPNNTGTIFRVGSITKQFTAVSILQLSERGMLSLNDTLDKYFPELPNSDKITIRNLLNHTSGIWDQEKEEDFPFPLEEAVPPHIHLSYIQKNGVYFEPGDQMRYSSNGYFVLGLIIEKVSGIPLAVYMQENIFDPLNMKDSRLFGTRTSYKHSAIGYGLADDGSLIEEADVNMATYSGAAALFSTADDLFIWNEAFHNGKVLENSSYVDAITPHNFSNGFVPFVDYGLGLGMEEVGSQYTIGHPGQLKGFHSDMLRIPGESINVIVLSNMNGHQFRVKWRFANKIIGIMYGE